MKHHTRTPACGAALFVAIALIACGGRQTMASKSAAAYDEAKKKGIPIASGEHGGHSNEAVEEPAGAAEPATEDPAMAGMDHSQMNGIDHSTMPGMQHHTPDSDAHDMAGMNHEPMDGMDHPKMPGMQHGGRIAPIVALPPTTNTAIAQTQPAVTLRADEFDAPAPTSIDEAAKAASGMSHHHGGGEAS